MFQNMGSKNHQQVIIVTYFNVNHLGVTKMQVINLQVIKSKSGNVPRCFFRNLKIREMLLRNPMMEIIHWWFYLKLGTPNNLLEMVGCCRNF